MKAHHFYLTENDPNTKTKKGDYGQKRIGVVLFDSSKTNVAISFCSKKDCFDPKIGLDIAKGRLEKRPIFITNKTEISLKDILTEQYNKGIPKRFNRVNFERANKMFNAIVHKD